MGYRIKEIFYSIQGEGFYTGRPAVLCRFSGCNLWSGKASDREKAVCRFCDTDFVGCDGPEGGIFQTPEALTEKIITLWPEKPSDTLRPFVVLTGGEPLLQTDRALLDALHHQHVEVAVETNGTIMPPEGIDWICVSPKAGTTMVLRSGQELKLVYPQQGAEPEKYALLDFQHYFLQPLDSPNRQTNSLRALEYVLAHPQWQLSLQIQKILNVK
ncbi:MAG TPA: 7-carboxy-7-deazaguanine synthase [Smithella sp.]|nr:7-carboxy-7-deazaguanine synthase [Smithella sp.]